MRKEEERERESMNQNNDNDNDNRKNNTHGILRTTKWNIRLIGMEMDEDWKGNKKKKTGMITATREEAVEGRIEETNG